MTERTESRGEWDSSREDAIPRLLDRHGARLYGLGRRLCGNPDDAEDLVQETFLQAYRKWDQFEGRSDPITWLYTIASRVCQRMHRKRSGEPDSLETFDELAPPGAGPVAVVSEIEDGMSEQIRREGKERLGEAIATLPLDFRMPLILKEIVGLPLADIAEVLAVKEATVKTRLHRARLKLRNALEEVLPTRDLPRPPYSRQVCLDLLRAKQEAMDNGTELRADRVLCERCQAVFASLDLTQDICRELSQGRMPDALRKHLDEAIALEGGG